MTSERDIYRIRRAVAMALEMGFSIKQIGEAVDASEPVIGNWRIGRTVPTEAKIAELERVAWISARERINTIIDVIFGGEFDLEMATLGEGIIMDRILGLADWYREEQEARKASFGTVVEQMKLEEVGPDLLESIKKKRK